MQRSILIPIVLLPLLMLGDQNRARALSCPKPVIEAERLDLVRDVYDASDLVFVGILDTEESGVATYRVSGVWKGDVTEWVMVRSTGMRYVYGAYLPKYPRAIFASDYEELPGHGYSETGACLALLDIDIKEVLKRLYGAPENPNPNLLLRTESFLIALLVGGMAAISFLIWFLSRGVGSKSRS